MPPVDDEGSDGLSALIALLQGLIDYAGLFPPAKLSMSECARNYGQYLRSPDSWMLGRFICPVSRLEEFRTAAAPLLPRRESAPVQNNGSARPEDMVIETSGDHADQPWPISALIDGDLDENLDAVFAFNHEHAQVRNGLAVIDAVEIKVPASGGGQTGAEFIDASLDLMSEDVYPFFEIPVQPDNADFRGMIAALSGADAGAKIRTGGVTPDAFPSPERVAEFILACAAADVPFKATAGLHHPVRAEHPLTYEPGCPRGIMHGFLNVFIAASAARTQRTDAATIAQVLAETDPRAFVFSEAAVTWRGKSIPAEALGLARETFALSYGSCSFTEPCEDLRKLGLAAQPRAQG